jgi:hypothetical protein
MPISVSTTGGTVTGPATSTNLAAAYGFNEGTGTTTADASGNGVTGQIQGATWTTSGKHGNALSFNGSSSYVDLGTPAVLQSTGSMTWSAWVYAAGTPSDDGQIVAMSDGNSGWQFKTSPDTGVRTFAIAVSPSSTSSTQRYSKTVPALNTWYHVAGVYNTATQTLDIYVNGVLDDGVLNGTVPSAQVLAGVNTTIGMRSGGYYFNGVIDDLRIYNRALSATEIQADMNTAVGTTAVAAPPTISSVQCSPASVASGASSTCTATLSGAAPSGGTTVTLSDNSTALTTPASVTVAAGATTGTFTVTAGSVTSSQSATVTATLAGVSKTATISLGTAMTLSSLACSPTTLASGAISTCTVTLSQAAPSTGTTISLSDNSTQLATATSVTVASGATSAKFNAVAGTITTSQSATITATLGAVSKTATIALGAPVTVSSLACSPTTLASGAIGTCTVTLSQAAPSGGASVAISDTSSALTTPATLAVAAGSSTASFTATAGTVTSNQSVTLTASLNGSSATAALTLSAPTSGTYSIWSPGTIPSASVSSGAEAVEVGVRFRADVSGNITGIRFYKASLNTGTHIGNLWTNTGTLLRSATFTAETASGWQQVNFSSPVAITAGATYVASYFAPAGHFSYSMNFFTSQGVDNAPLHALADNVDGRNGIYIFNTSSSFPNVTYMAENYWVDVVFSATQSSPATVRVSSVQCSPASIASVSSSACTVTLSAAAPSGGATVTISDNSSALTSPASVTVAAGASSAGFSVSTGTVTASQPVTLTASLNGSSVSAALTITPPVITISSLNCLPATVASGSSASCTVTFSGALPTGGAVLAISDSSSALTTPATLTVAAGVSSAVFSAAAGAVTANQSVTVTASLNGSSAKAALTISAPASGSHSIWSTTAIPLSSVSSTSDAVEVGVRFRSDVSGYITGIRFYKASLNTGTHIGNLWTNTGTLLKSATFTGETASGWQQVNFSSPVAITAGTTYVASYFAPAGHFSYSMSAFASQGVDNAPLHALADNVDGRNGIYLYSNSSKFPTMTYMAENYWVDVVFSSSTSSTAGASLVSMAKPAASSPEAVSASSQTSAAVSALSCSPRSVTAGSLVTCELRVPPSPAPGRIQLATSSAQVAVPSAVSARSSQSSLTFQAAIDPLAPQQAVVITATSGAGEVQDTLVVNAGAAPVLSVPGRQLAKIGTPVSFAVKASDPGNLPVQLSARGVPGGATFDAATGNFNWVPGASQAGQYQVTFTAGNSAGQSASGTVTLDVDSGKPALDAQTLACSPGAISRLTGKWLASGDAPLSDATGGSMSLGGTRVAVNGEAAPVLFSSAAEVRFLCPAVNPGTPLSVTVESDAGAAGPLAGTMLEATPAILTVDGSGQGQGLVSFAGTGDLVMSRNFRIPAEPAQPGDEIQIQATGLGGNAVSAGSVLVDLSGIAAEVQSITAVPGEAGVFMIQARVPAAVAFGDAVPVEIQVVTPDGRRFDSNRATVAVEAVRQ